MQLSLYIIPWLITIVLTFALGVYAYQHRKTNAAIPFALMCFLAALWATGYIIDLSSTSLQTKVLMEKISYFGIVGVPLCWTAFALQFTGRGHWLNRKTVIVTLIIPVITIFMVWTTEIHHLLWSELSIYTDRTSGLVLLSAPAGWWFWIHAVYTYSVLLLGAFFLLRQFWEQQDIYRAQTFINIIAILIPWIANAIVIFQLLPIKIDITSLAFGITIMLLGWAFFRYRFLDLVPVAHRAVFDSIPDSVIILDPAQRVVELNPAALSLFNLEAAKVIGQDFSQSFGRWLELDQVHLAEGGYHGEIQLNLDEKPVQCFDMIVSNLQEDAKQGTGKLMILRDITARKKYETELAEARDEAVQASGFKTQLLAKVSHELRTPLGVIIGYADLITQGVYGPINEKQGVTIQRMRDSGEYLNTLVGELLDQAQLDSGRLKLAIESYSPFEVLEPTCARLSILAEAKGLALTASFAPDLPEKVTGDSHRVQQILTNLIGNAIKFTEQGSIRVNVIRSSQDDWCITVTDTGTGIPMDALETIFEPFRQLDQPAKTARKGYGLGLSIIKQLVTLMGGAVSVKSVLGQGSTFLVVLPIHPGD